MGKWSISMVVRFHHLDIQDDAAGRSRDRQSPIGKSTRIRMETKHNAITRRVPLVMRVLFWAAVSVLANYIGWWAVMHPPPTQSPF